jgi:magnesium chelatase family protein
MLFDMSELRTKVRQAELNDLLRRDHTLNGGILVGLDGHVVEVQARAVEVLRKPGSWDSPTITGMNVDAALEVKQRIKGAFAKLNIHGPEGPC